MPMWRERFEKQSGIPYRTQINRLKSDGELGIVNAAFGKEPPEGGYWGPNQTRDEALEGRELSEKLYAYLRSARNRSGVHLSDLADEFDCSPQRIRDAVGEAEKSGKHLHRVGEVVSAHVLPGTENRVSLDIEPREKMYIGIVSDTHLGSKKQQPKRLYEFMMRAADEYPLDCWLHAGDLTDGIPEVYQGHMHEVWMTRADDQVEYAAQVYPDTGVDTWAIAGNHDEKANKKAGINVVAGMAERREDFHYVDFYGGYVDVGGISCYLWHPPGGSSYAKSYKLQRFVEGFDDTGKPDFVFAGHLHQFTWVWHRGVQAFLVPSFQGTTTFIRRLGYQSMVGGMVVEVSRDDYGVPVEVTPRLTRLDAIENDYPGYG